MQATIQQQELPRRGCSGPAAGVRPGWAPQGSGWPRRLNRSPVVTLRSCSQTCAQRSHWDAMTRGAFARCSVAPGRSQHGTTDTGGGWWHQSPSTPDPQMFKRGGRWPSTNLRSWTRGSVSGQLGRALDAGADSRRRGNISALEGRPNSNHAAADDRRQRRPGSRRLGSQEPSRPSRLFRSGSQA